MKEKIKKRPRLFKKLESLIKAQLLAKQTDAYRQHFLER